MAEGQTDPSNVLLLKAALAALPAGWTPATAIATLNAATIATPIQPVAVADIHGILLMSGDWAKVVSRSKQTASGANPPTAADNAIPVAADAMILAGSDSKIVTIYPADWAAFTASFLAILEASGDVSAGSLSAINLLAQPTSTIPQWQPPVTVGHIQTAEAS